jgi:hypothetical protein
VPQADLEKLIFLMNVILTVLSGLTTGRGVDELIFSDDSGLLKELQAGSKVVVLTVLSGLTTEGDVDELIFSDDSGLSTELQAGSKIEKTITIIICRIM